jgi:hypothetical protein
MTEQLGRRPQYEAFADEFLAHAEDGFYNAHYDGFLIERLAEPRPAPEAAAFDPEHYEKLTREPRGFIAFRLVPRPSAG